MNVRTTTLLIKKTQNTWKKKETIFYLLHWPLLRIILMPCDDDKDSGTQLLSYTLLVGGRVAAMVTRTCCKECNELTASSCCTCGIHPSVHASAAFSRAPSQWLKWATSVQCRTPLAAHLCSGGLLIGLAEAFAVLRCNVKLCLPIPSFLPSSFTAVSPAECSPFLLLLLLPLLLQRCFPQ